MYSIHVYAISYGVQYPRFVQPVSTVKKAYDMKSAELLELERELGLIDDFPTAATTAAAVEGTDSPLDSAGVGCSKVPERRLGGGCVQTSWLCGVFGGSVPAPIACWLHDWAILTEDKYAGKSLVPPQYHNSVVPIMLACITLCYHTNLIMRSSYANQVSL